MGTAYEKELERARASHGAQHLVGTDYEEEFKRARTELKGMDDGPLGGSKFPPSHPPDDDDDDGLGAAALSTVRTEEDALDDVDGDAVEEMICDIEAAPAPASFGLSPVTPAVSPSPPPAAPIDSGDGGELPPGLRDEHRAAFPRAATIVHEIHAIEGKKLADALQSRLPGQLWRVIQELKANLPNVQTSIVQSALKSCNDSNAASATDRFIRPVQTHAAGPTATRLINGSWPTTTTMNEPRSTLSSHESATVVAIALSEGYKPDEFASALEFIRINDMPTTLAGVGYTGVPTAADFNTFRNAHVKCVAECLRAGCRLSPLPRYSHALGQQEPISRRSRK